MSVAAPTMTGEEFIRLDGHELMSLVDGVPLVEETVRSLHHGQVCATVGGVLHDFVKLHHLGRACSNNTSIRLSRKPDTVLGPDLCYFSYKQMPKGAEPDGVCDIIPELVVEVAMPTNPWSRMLFKAGRYVTAGVKLVLLVDLETNTASLHRDDITYLDEDGIVTFPDVLPGFSVPLSRLFE